MFCIKCGNELSDGAKFCTSCGTLLNISDSDIGANPNSPDDGIRHPEINARPETKPGEPVKRPGRKGLFLKILAVLTAAIILISGVTVLGYYTFMPAKLTLQIAAAASTRKSYDAFDKSMSLYEKKHVKPLFEDSTQTETRLSISVERALMEQFLPLEIVDIVSDVINNLSLHYARGLDIKNRKQTVEFGVNYLLNPLLTASLYLDGSKFGASIPELSEKYIVGDTKNLSNVPNIFPDISPEFIEAYENTDLWIASRLYEDARIDRKDIKKVMETYTKELIDSIDAGNMSIKRGQRTSVAGKDMKCHEITITLDGDAQRKILKNLLRRLKDDDNVYELTFGYLKKIYDVLGENEYYQKIIEESGLEDFLSKDAYKENLSKLEDEIEDTDFLEEIVAKVYIKNLDIVKYAFDFPAGTEDENVRFTIEKISDGLSCKSRYALNGGMEGNGADLALVLDKSYDDARDLTDFAAELDITMNTSEGTGTFNLTVESNEELDGKNDVRHTMDALAKLDLTINENQIQGDLFLNLDGAKTRNSKGLVIESDYKGELGFNAPDLLPQPIKLNFAVDTETAYGEKIKIPEPDEVLDIATASREDFDQLVNEMQQKLGSLLMVLSGY